MLALSFVLSFVRLSRDPAATGMYELLGLAPAIFPVAMIINALSAAVGAIAVPHFWHRVLHITLSRELFVRAMICAYAAVVMVWDVASLTWINTSFSRELPLWLPEIVKTGIITAYCSVISTHMVKKEHHGTSTNVGV